MKSTNNDKEVFRIFNTVNDLQRVLGREVLIKLSAYDKTDDEGIKICITIEYPKWKPPKLDVPY